MIGGGFGGCTLNIIQSDQAKSTIANICRSYTSITGIKAAVYEVKIVDGVKVFTK